MENIDCRRLFKLAGAGSVVAAGAALPLVGRMAGQDSNVLGFRGTLGLPDSPLPNYATLVIEGTVNRATGTGLVTSRVLAGHPADPGEVGLPGLTRIIRVSSVDRQGSQLNLRGIVEDRSSFAPVRVLKSKWSSTASARRLFAADAGSDQISVLDVHDGGLALVGAFASGGSGPVSLTYAEGSCMC